MNTPVLWMAVTIILLVVVLALVTRVAVDLHARAEKLRSDNQSLSTRFGKVAEQLLPFTDDYPYDPSNFRFIGSPVDGVQFEEDRVVFLEFKTGKSKLTNRQRQIRDLVKSGRVEFREVRL